MQRPAPDNASETLACIASTLRRRRGELNLSQEALAAASGMSRARLNRIEQNLADNMRLSTLARLAEGLQFDIRNLLDGAAIRPHRRLSLEPQLRVMGNVAHLRQEAGLSQEDLSLGSGHFRAYVSRLEGLRIDPTVTALVSIAARLGVPVVDLFRPRKLGHIKQATRAQAPVLEKPTRDASAEIEHIASILRGRREELGFSQEAAARACGLSRSNFVHLEQKTVNNPRLSTLVRLADGLQLEILDLVDFQNGRRHHVNAQDPAIRLALNVHRLRKSMGLSQVDLSLQSGHFVRYINALEVIRADPSIDSLKRIAKQLGVASSDLLAPVPTPDYEKLLVEHVGRQIRRTENRQ
ncbi:helix-turn-helix domain-containing protein [Paraburkholderia humisilvae]|nr:helix-turn-helix domain-containing protein [Paraburkholderia humisilvae]